MIFPDRAPSNASVLTPDEILLGVDPGADRHAGTQAGYQLALLVTTLLVSILGGLLTGKDRHWKIWGCGGGVREFPG